MKALTIIKSIIAATVLSFTAQATAGVETSTNSDNVILAGHDAVAYFTENRAVLGSAEFTATHKDAVYRFSSAQNRDLFTANPNKYEPAYGGYCAYGASLGKKFSVNGKAFKVVNGKLYVNKNLSVYKTWVKDIPGNIKKADGHWKNIKSIPANQL